MLEYNKGENSSSDLCVFVYATFMTKKRESWSVRDYYEITCCHTGLDVMTGREKDRQNVFVKNSP